MIEYQNLFTRVQLRTDSHGPAHTGLPLPRGDFERTGEPWYFYWAGRVGEAQIGPIYLGVLGSASIVFGVLWFWIVGFSMLSSVNWNIIEMIRQLPWLALEPPPPEYGLRMPPLHKGGWWVIASQLQLQK